MTLASRSNETASLTPTPRDLHRSWTREEALALYEAPFNDLLFQAQTVHREHFDPNKVQLSRLLSIKTGGCPEDCGYCSQSTHHDSGLKASRLMEVERVVAEARKARDAGATRYCMGAAWRSPKDRDMDAVVAMVEGVKALGMETCMTLGMLDSGQAARLGGGRSRLLQPQHRYVRALLRRDHFHAQLRGPPGDPRACPGIRHQGLLRRHRRHGRRGDRPRRHAGDAGQPAGTSGERADQYADPDTGHAAGEGRSNRSDSHSCAPSRWRAS